MDAQILKPYNIEVYMLKHMFLIRWFSDQMTNHGTILAIVFVISIKEAFYL